MPDVPAALRWLVAAALLAGVAWALLVPAWQVPDEDAHFAYVQTLAELHRLPGRRRPPALRRREVDGAGPRRARERLPDSAQRIEVRPDLEPRRRGALGRGGGRAARRGARRTAAARLAPAATRPATTSTRRCPTCWRARGDVFDRLYLMRLWSVLLLALFAVSGWLLAGELVGRDRQRADARGRRGLRARADGHVRLGRRDAGRAALPAVGPRLLARGRASSAAGRAAGT